jgi:FkbM family methyltransferase
VLAHPLGGFRPHRDSPLAPLFELDELAQRPRLDNEARIRALCASAYLGGETAVCRVLGRYKMFVDTGDVGLSAHLLLDGYWEMWLTEALAAAVRPGMTVLDIGANLGYFSLLMAERVGASGRVLAFEPNPAVAARLRRNISVNGFDEWAAAHPWALSDKDGAEVLLVVPEGEPKNAHIVPAGHCAPGPGAHPMLTRRLDSFPEALCADVIKIDADTAEEAIWRGMVGLFDMRRSMTVFLEFAAARYPDPAAFLADIAHRGFSLARLDLDGVIRTIDAPGVLAGPPTKDQMLVLRR